MTKPAVDAQTDTAVAVCNLLYQLTSMFDDHEYIHLDEVRNILVDAEQVFVEFRDAHPDVWLFVDSDLQGATAHRAWELEVIGEAEDRIVKLLKDG